MNVVAVPLPRSPPRLLLGDRGCDLLPVIQRPLGQLSPDSGEARAVAEQLAQCHLLLAGGRELRPVAGDRIVEVGGTPRDEHQQCQAGKRLSHREGVDDRVSSPGPSTRCVGPPAPQIHNRTPVEHHRDRRTELAPLGDVLPQRLPDGGEARVAASLDVPVAASQEMPLGSLAFSCWPRGRWWRRPRRRVRRARLRTGG